MTNDGIKREIESTNVKWCAVCGGDHERLIVKALNPPKAIGFGPPMTHSAQCPTKQETLFLRIG
jgi:hypothetical protein